MLLLRAPAAGLSLLLASPSAALRVGAATRPTAFRSALATMSAKTFKGPVVMGTEEIMADKGKGHGTSAVPIQKDLRWNCDIDTADKICNHNRHYAEYGGYWEKTSFLKEESEASGEITFYDSNTGKPLFYGPKDRDWAAFVKESKAHGWPSFRDSEVNWDFVRILPKCAARCRTRTPPRPPRPSACCASTRASRCVAFSCHPLLRKR